MRPAVVIPTYDEAENIARLLGGIRALPGDVRAIVVDDNSPDGTGELVARIAAGDPGVQLLRRPAKLGLGTAHLAGFRAAWDAGFDPVLTMDADFSHDPAQIPDLLAVSAEADLVIGSRYVPGGGTRNCPLGRRLLSRTANAVARAALGLAAADCTAGFRCYRRAVIEVLLATPIAANGYSFLVEVLARVQRHGFRVREVPILFVDRRFGVSKISKNEIARAAATVWRLFRQRVRGPLPIMGARDGEGSGR
jgi:glycosyltransferase involved in cell wall biosynthesis